MLPLWSILPLKRASPSRLISEHWTGCRLVRRPEPFWARAGHSPPSTTDAPVRQYIQRRTWKRTIPSPTPQLCSAWANGATGRPSLRGEKRPPEDTGSDDIQIWAPWGSGLLGRCPSSFDPVGFPEPVFLQIVPVTVSIDQRKETRTGKRAPNTVPSVWVDIDAVLKLRDEGLQTNRLALLIWRGNYQKAIHRR